MAMMNALRRGPAYQKTSHDSSTFSSDPSYLSMPNNSPFPDDPGASDEHDYQDTPGQRVRMASSRKSAKDPGDPMQEMKGPKGAPDSPRGELREGLQGGEDPQELMARLWDKHPTDDMGMMIEMMSRRLGVSPPWGKDAKTGKLAPLDPKHLYDEGY